MKVLMFGWEFPPFNSGGLGTACYGITRALSEKGVEINFILPQNQKIPEKFLNVISAELPKIKIKEIDSLLTSYMTSENYRRRFLSLDEKDLVNNYCSDLIGEVCRYSQIARKIAREVEHDIIHTHDWMTFLPGIEAQKVSNKPLVSHVHSTELDRSGGHGANPQVFSIEKNGVQKADKVIAVSDFTKNKILKSYDVNSNKIDIVHNAIYKDEFADNLNFKENFDFGKNKIVLFLGRLTLHKGPDYFLCAAKKVLEKNKNVIFIVSGSGDMDQQIIEQAADLGIADKVLFTGFLRGEKLKKIYKMASLYIMPSISEPFGITTLESIASGTPVLISKQSGVSEILNHCLKVDFWDIDEMTNKILSVIDHDELGECLSSNGLSEIDKLTWDKAAERIIRIYGQLLREKCHNVL
ncbi:MAG: glycosyltransferase family 4 protein [Candidatus Pacebacteria bacterium]|nr:glycosyltransferase family 4 protein [Candidatus Paceibacterota bacterium]